MGLLELLIVAEHGRDACILRSGLRISFLEAMISLYKLGIEDVDEDYRFVS